MSKLSFSILPLETYVAEVLNDISELLKEVFIAEVKVLQPVTMPKDLKNLYRGQFDGLKVLDWITTITPLREVVLVGIADADAYVPGLNFIFGIADPNKMVALVFLGRLKSDAPTHKLILRVRKEVLHEVGHVLGLKHCSIKRCVMTFSNTIYDTDYKEYKYCRRCYSTLLSLGYNVNVSYVID